MKIVAEFSIPYYQYLNETSELSSDAPSFASEKDTLISLYRYMLLTRIFDTKAIALQRTGKLGTYPSTKGQEAVFVGLGAGLERTDVFIPYYRDVGTLIQRGVSLADILLFWGGDERGNMFAEVSNNLPYAVPVGSQTLHACGIATALKIKKQKHAVLVTCGDGGSSQGDFYEAMNLAGIWQLPVVFVVSNNQWAISVPRSAQTASATIAQKAIAAGIPGEQIDGNDVIAVTERVKVAAQNARENNQPSLLEIVSYRHSDHTTADDASRYETHGLRDTEWVKEPIERLRRYLEEKKFITQELAEKIQNECSTEVELQVEKYMKVEKQNLISIFEYLYAEIPAIYQTQLDLLAAKSEREYG